jgi:hypothetical protein
MQEESFLRTPLEKRQVTDVKTVEELEDLNISHINDKLGKKKKTVIISNHDLSMSMLNPQTSLGDNQQPFNSSSIPGNLNSSTLNYKGPIKEANPS